jgi:DNA-binding NarL/FixJ family response regulator
MSPTRIGVKRAPFSSGGRVRRGSADNASLLPFRPIYLQATRAYDDSVHFTDSSARPRRPGFFSCAMNSHPGRAKPKPYHAPSLTGRENQVAQCVAMGLKNKEIADMLFINEQTVKHYLSRIFHKTGAKDRFEVALWMISRDLAD